MVFHHVTLAAVKRVNVELRESLTVSTLWKRYTIIVSHCECCYQKEYDKLAALAAVCVCVFVLLKSNT